MVPIIHKTSKNLKPRIIQHDFTLILNINFPHFRIFYGNFYLTGKTKSAQWYPVLKQVVAPNSTLKDVIKTQLAHIIYCAPILSLDKLPDPF